MEGLFVSAAPLMLAGIGALLSDLSGALGIFIEGFMNAGAFFSWVFAGWTGSVFTGVLLSAMLAGLAGWGLAYFVRISGANPFIAGLAVNLAVAGLTNTLSAAWFGTKGVLRSPGLSAAVPIDIPLLKSIPFLGQLFSGHSAFVYAAWALTITASFIIGKTAIGFRLSASGAAPEACLERGIRPELYREGAWAAAAFLAALAGAALTFRVGAYTPGGAAGRGWIALAAVYLGFRRVWGVAAAALLFSMAERLGYGIQSFGIIPATALLGLPAALALVLYTVSNWAGRKKFNAPPPPE
ncbi:MAG: ABC transporter permease [Treponema sp.]|jgi:simple sugar transport system permease protein|nr:ABC transporter permease [Treponema sp.]